MLGVIGAQGVGKSTLIAELAKRYRERYSVGILAVDPTSKLSGGALLGDRVRMGGLEGVFIRSFGTRGCSLGFSRAVLDAICLLDACGRELILVETIGLGQDQTWIRQLCHTCILVLTPASGDEIQMLKAGLMEVADIIAINKSDLGGADQLELMIRSYIKPRDGWEPPVLKLSALRSQGMEQLIQAIQEHFQACAQIKQSLMRLRLELELREQLESKLDRVLSSSQLQELVEDLAGSKLKFSQAIQLAMELMQES